MAAARIISGCLKSGNARRKSDLMDKTDLARTIDLTGMKPPEFWK